MVIVMVVFIMWSDILVNCYLTKIFLTIVHQSNSEVHIHWKGAAEIILDSCTEYLDINGRLQYIDQDKVR